MIKTTLKAITFTVAVAASAIVMPVNLSVVPHVQAAEWYEGGTLHQATALEWQQASDANKLATAADIAASAYTKKLLKPDLQNAVTGVDSLLPLAYNLVKGLDAAFEPDPDPETNRVMFANQKVSDFMVMLMASQGWLK